MHVVFRIYDIAVGTNSIVVLAKLRRSSEKYTANWDSELFGKLHPMSSCFLVAVGVVWRKSAKSKSENTRQFWNTYQRLQMIQSRDTALPL